MARDPRKTEQSFFSKLRISEQVFEGTHCIEWTGLTNKGHGRLYAPDIAGRDDKYVQAHRWFFEQIYGPLPDALYVDHRCFNRACQNVLHLEPVTNRENIKRGFRRMEACRKGHTYNQQNTLYTANGFRWCRVCDRNKKRIRRAIARGQDPSLVPLD